MDQPVLSSPIQHFLDALLERFSGLDSGAVADYIPELATADPAAFGIALVTVDGHVYQSGDTRQPFTIQSISKALVYGLALEDNGVEAVTAKIGVEPSGDAFNSISLETGTGRPLNPMINAGAIATTGLVHGADRTERLARILSCFGRYTGHDMTVDEVIYASERDTGHRNRAIAHMLRNFDILEGDPDDALDVYFRQCSINVTCRDLALAAATLANRGVNPITGVVALKRDMVHRVLSVMSTCGMYDYAGSWIYEVGLPAKSGVGGGIMAVLPGQLGLGVFSPPLDTRGNSVRGIAVCREISRYFDLHLYNAARTAPSVIRASYSGSKVRSRRTRSREQGEELTRLGDRIGIYELYGDLTFGTTEIVIHDLFRTGVNVDYLLLDLRRVHSMDPAAARLLAGLCEEFFRSGKSVFLTHARQRFDFERRLRASLRKELVSSALRFDERDQALEWCEDKLLAAHAPKTLVQDGRHLGASDFVSGLDEAALQRLEGLLQRRAFRAGDCIARRGDDAAVVYFLIRGTVSISLESGSGGRTRLATMSAGMTFGESALIGDSHRTADILADTDVECFLLHADQLQDVGDPVTGTIRSRLIENLALSLADKLRSANREIQALS